MTRPFKDLADAMSPESRARADSKAAALSQTTGAWAFACKQYSLTYDPHDPQRSLWLRRAELPKSEAHHVTLKEVANGN